MVTIGCVHSSDNRGRWEAVEHGSVACYCPTTPALKPLPPHRPKLLYLVVSQFHTKYELHKVEIEDVHFLFNFSSIMHYDLWYGLTSTPF